MASLPASDIGSILPLGARKNNVNQPNAASDYNDAFTSRTILVPIGVSQIGAFAFDYHGTDEIDLSLEAPDHWLEDNSAAQDHVAIKPFIVTLRGFVAELNLSPALFNKLNTALYIPSITSNLSQVGAYTGGYTPGAVNAMLAAITAAQNAALLIQQAISKGSQLASLFSSGPAMNRQQQAYFQISSLALARVVFTVATPFQVFDNMVITGLRTVQPENTKGWADFTVSLKQLNFSDDLSLPFFSANFDGRAAAGFQPLTQNGGTSGRPVPSTNLFGAFPP